MATTVLLLVAALATAVGYRTRLSSAVAALAMIALLRTNTTIFNSGRPRAAPDRHRRGPRAERARAVARRRPHAAAPGWPRPRSAGRRGRCACCSSSSPSATSCRPGPSSAARPGTRAPRSAWRCGSRTCSGSPRPSGCSSRTSCSTCSRWATLAVRGRRSCSSCGTGGCGPGCSASACVPPRHRPVLRRRLLQHRDVARLPRVPPARRRPTAVVGVARPPSSASAGRRARHGGSASAVPLAVEPAE